MDSSVDYSLAAVINGRIITCGLYSKELGPEQLEREIKSSHLRLQTLGEILDLLGDFNDLRGLVGVALKFVAAMLMLSYEKKQGIFYRFATWLARRLCFSRVLLDLSTPKGTRGLRTFIAAYELPREGG